MKFTKKIKSPIKTKWFLATVVFVILTLSCSENQYVFNKSESNQKPNLDIDLNEINQLIDLKESEFSNTFFLFEKVNKQINSNRKRSAETTNKLFESLSVHHKIDRAFENILQSNLNDSIKNEVYISLLYSSVFYNNTFQQNHKIRKIINRGDDAYHLPKNWLHKMEKYLLEEENQICGIAAENLKNSVHHLDYSKTKYFFQKQYDFLSESAYHSAGFISKLTSKLLFHFKYESNINQEPSMLIKNLKKWDLVCLKNPKNLTDVFIPGYFGHIAIYMGNGIIAESVQSGVRLSSITDFTKDECSYLVIRPKGLNTKQKEKMERCLNAQIGKSYDYNYDIESHDKLICTELIYLVFDQIKWDSKNILGRKIIYPDLIVKSAQNNPEFKFLLYLNDNSSLANPDSNFIAQLIN